MSSEAQVLANRRNASRSTGPRTIEGKDVVSQNAVKHGLSTRRDVIRGDAEEFERHRREMLDDLAPVGAMKAMLAGRIVSLSWRLIRAQRMQDAAIEAPCANYVRGPCLHDILERVAKTVPSHTRKPRRSRKTISGRLNIALNMISSIAIRTPWAAVRHRSQSISRIRTLRK